MTKALVVIQLKKYIDEDSSVENKAQAIRGMMTRAELRGHDRMASIFKELLDELNQDLKSGS